MHKEKNTIKKDLYVVSALPVEAHDDSLAKEQAAKLALAKKAAKKAKPSSENAAPLRKRNKSYLIDEMQEIKKNIGLTTRSLTNFMRIYEYENMEQTLAICDKHGVEFVEISQPSFSAYTDGWVANEAHNKAFHERLLRLSEHIRSKYITSATDLDKSFYKADTAPQIDMRTKMRGWFDAMNIPMDNPRISPWRLFAEFIAPYYERPIKSKHSGIFKIVGQNEHHIEYIIDEGSRKKPQVFNNLCPTDPLFVVDGQRVFVDQILQRTLHLTFNRKKNRVEPMSTHTTFFRWHKDNRPPAEITDIQDVELAIERFLKNTKAADRIAIVEQRGGAPVKTKR